MSPMVYIEVDRKPFSHVKLEHSTTAAELRNYLAEKKRLSSNVYFLDTNDYPITEEEEDTETITQLLNGNNVIRMKSETTNLEEKTILNPTTNTNTNRQKIIHRSANFFITELLSVFRYAWHSSLKPIVSILLGVLVTIIIMYYLYIKVVCGYLAFLPIITMSCPVRQLDSISVPPISKLAEQTTSLAEVLMNADVSAPMRLVQGKSSLIQIRSQVMYSDIDATVKLELTTQMRELEKLIQESADHLTSMLSSFGGTLDKLKIYTQYIFEDVSKIIRRGANSNRKQLQLGKVNFLSKILFTIFSLIDK